jgi:hypothetical protein
LKEGDEITVSCEGETLPGTILMVSSNQNSLFVSFDGRLSGHLGAAALLWEDGRYRSIISGVPMTVAPRAVS